MRLIKFLICCVSVLIFSINTINAQTNILNTNKVENIGVKTDQQNDVDGNDKPLPYGYTSNDDILWSKVVWELIDLNQKINHPFYYPIDSTTVGTDRLSLFNTLQKYVWTDSLQIYSDSYFKKKMTIEDLDELTYRDCKDGLNTGEIKPEEITRFRIKGMWYFDKRLGELKYRLIGIAPLYSFDAGTKCGQIEDYNNWEKENGEQSDLVMPENIRDPQPLNYKSLYWVFYPEARQVLHDSKVFNPENSVNAISFDHLLNARRFSSVIIQEENVYGNRKISDYIKDNSLFQLLEADKIKEDIRNREMDMWNY
jgi:gliding motility associated protien GldN